MTDLFYSFGVSHPGAITLHNYPRHCRTCVATMASTSISRPSTSCGIANAAYPATTSSAGCFTRTR